MLNLDTHILLSAWAGQLTRHERRLLAEDQWSISAIVLWEMAKLSQFSRRFGRRDHRRNKPGA